MNLPCCLLASGVLALGCGSGDRRSGEGLPAPLAVQVVRVIQTQVPVIVPVVGTTQPHARAAVGTPLLGWVEQVPVDEGDRVQRGQVLVRLEDRELRARHQQLQAALEEVQAVLEQAGRDAQRQRDLHREQAVPQQSLDEAQTHYARALASVAAAQAQARQVEAELGHTVILSPLDGVVVRRFVQQGDMAIPGAPLLEVEQQDPIQVVLEVAEQHLQAVQVGQNLALDRPGRVIALVPAVGPRSRTFRAKLELSNADGRIGSGLFARAHLPLGSRSAVVAPAGAMVREGQLQGVYAVESGRARLRWVRLGREWDGWVEVLSGLEPGAEVIAAPVPGLRDGSPVEARGDG